jgi:hypothetical protein
VSIKKQIYRLKISLYAFLAGIQFNVIGQLGGNDILAVVDSFSLGSWKRLYRDIPDIKKINIAYLIMLIFQVISDMVNNSDSHDYLRGWANIMMAVIVLNFLAKYLFKSFNVIIYFFLAEIIRFIIFKPPEGFDASDFSENIGVFKFWIAPILNDIVLLVSVYILGRKKSSNRDVLPLFITYGLLCIALDYRSNGIFFILASLIIIFYKYLINYNRQKMLALLFGFLIIFQGLFILYVKEVQEGEIGGEHSKIELKEVNYSYNPFNLLLIGRTDFFVAMIAIKDKPVFGFGSWAPDPTGKYLALSYELRKEDRDIGALMKADFILHIIPAHSVLMGSWLNGGIGTFLPILFLFVLYLRRCFYLISKKDILYNKYFPILIFFMFNAFWTFLFSPLPAIKTTLPIMLAFVFVMYQKFKNQELIEQNAGI